MVLGVQVAGLTLVVMILAGYAAALWWLLRRESSTTLCALLVVCMLSFVLRLACAGNYPPGWFEDEPKLLACSYKAWQQGAFFSDGCIIIPILLSALFEGPLLPILGPGAAAMRSYSVITSVLASVAAFAAARALRCRVGPSLASAAFLAVLPWAIFFGRVSIGGEMVFHALLLIAALSRLIFSAGTYVETGIGAFGLCLLLYDYYCGWAMLGVALVAAMVARGRQRWQCLAVVPLALLGWAPFLSGYPPSVFRDFHTRLRPDFLTTPVATVATQTAAVFHTVIAPVGKDAALCIRSAALHPALILVLAVIGLGFNLRRSVFLAVSFLGVLTPAIISEGGAPSAHRMLMAFPFIALAASCALDQIPGQRTRALLSALAVAWVGTQSVSWYFSAAFWPPVSRQTFEPDRTAVIEALPWAADTRLIIDPSLLSWFEPRSLLDHHYEYLNADNWLPSDRVNVVYAFDRNAVLLQPLYQSWMGAERVRTFGGAFMVKLEARDWSWMRQHGWSYAAICDGRAWHGQAPTLFQHEWMFRDMHCVGPATYTWRGRWRGPAADLRLRFTGTATVETSPGGHFEKAGRDINTDFFTDPAAGLDVSVAPETTVVVQVTTTRAADPRAVVALLQRGPASERLPPWEWVDPVAE